MSPDKKVAIITGSARGIGAATMRVFAQHGFAVVGLDILPEGEWIAQEINQQGGEGLFLQCDVADEAGVGECIKKVGDKYGHIDVLVNNAGVVLVKPFDQISWEEFQRTTANRVLDEGIEIEDFLQIFAEGGFGAGVTKFTGKKPNNAAIRKAYEEAKRAR